MAGTTPPPPPEIKPNSPYYLGSSSDFDMDKEMSMNSLSFRVPTCGTIEKKGKGMMVLKTIRKQDFV